MGFRTNLYRAMTDAAYQHGCDSEPDHEVGDLQDFLREALEFIPEDKLKALADRDIVRDIILENGALTGVVPCDMGRDYYTEGCLGCPEASDCEKKG